MGSFVPTDDFKVLNVGFALDEGGPSATDIFRGFYAEKTIWAVVFKISGTPGHGSLLHKNTAGEKLRILLDKIMDFREEKIELLSKDVNLEPGDVTSLNFTMASGGIQDNVVPPSFEINIDMRIAIDVDHKEYEEKLRKWCEEAGGGIEIFFKLKQPYVDPTRIDDSNPFWLAFKSVFDEMNAKINMRVLIGGTDARFLRMVGIPAFGFSPMINTQLGLLHAHNEAITVETYLNGIQVYKSILRKIANV